jgi:hypothetical protein
VAITHLPCGPTALLLLGVETSTAKKMFLKTLAPAQRLMLANGTLSQSRQEARIARGDETIMDSRPPALTPKFSRISQEVDFTLSHCVLMGLFSPLGITENRNATFHRWPFKSPKSLLVCITRSD